MQTTRSTAAVQQRTHRAGDDVEEAEDGGEVASGLDALAELVAEVRGDVVVDRQLHAEAIAVREPQDPGAVVTAQHATTRQFSTGITMPSKWVRRRARATASLTAVTAVARH